MKSMFWDFDKAKEEKKTQPKSHSKRVKNTAKAFRVTFYMPVKVVIRIDFTYRCQLFLLLVLTQAFVRDTE